MKVMVQRPLKSMKKMSFFDTLIFVVATLFSLPVPAPLFSRMLTFGLFLYFFGALRIHRPWRCQMHIFFVESHLGAQGRKSCLCRAPLGASLCRHGASGISKTSKSVFWEASRRFHKTCVFPWRVCYKWLLGVSLESTREALKMHLLAPGRQSVLLVGAKRSFSWKTCVSPTRERHRVPS